MRTNMGLGAACLAAIVLASACRSDPTPPQPAPTASVVATSRVIAIEASAAGFVPARVDVRADEALTLRFTRTTKSGCLSRLVFPTLGVERELELGVATDVQLVTPRSGEVAFECGMAMTRGRLVVEGSGDAPSSSSSATTAPTAKPHADHDPRHGGVVTMEGDMHVEIVVARDGKVDLYVSDDVRTSIPPAEVTGALTLGPGKAGVAGDRITLTADPKKGSLSARTPPPKETTEYTWDLKARGQTLHMTLAVPEGGTAAFASPGSSIDPGASKPVLRALGAGQAKLVLSSSGLLTVELLDASRQHASARGASATARLAGGAEVPLAYDERADVLHAELGPVGKKEHADAIVAITPSGGRPAQLRVTFHLEQSAR